MHLVYPAVLAALLFATGLYGVLARRNAILVLMSVELMLAAVSLNLVAFDVWLRDTLHSGQVFTLFLIALSAAEIGIGLAIVLLMYRTNGTSAIDQMRQLDGGARPDSPPTPSSPTPPADPEPTRENTVT
jgi:NADH-quinone oxidoreductase subunit K